MELLGCCHSAQVHGDQEMQSIEVLAEESLRISEPPDGYSVGELDADAAEPPPDWLEVEVTQVSLLWRPQPRPRATNVDE